MEGTLLIDHFNTLLVGGAAVAANRLHQGLLHAGIDSRLWFASKEFVRQIIPSDLGPGVRPVPWPLPDESLGIKAHRISQQFLRKVQLRLLRSYYRRGKKRKHGGFLGVRQSIATPFDRMFFESDIIHFHWIGNLIDFPSFFHSMPAEKPLVWSLHDMNPMTGGCSHSGDCDGFTRWCGDCPILARPGPEDLSHQELKIKHTSLRDRNVFIVAPSYWMAGMAKRSSLFSKCQVEVIRNPIDTKHFFPVSCAGAVAKHVACRVHTT